jgi:hypothetical protein
MTFVGRIVRGYSNAWMRGPILGLLAVGRAVAAHGQEASQDFGPAAALRFEMSYRGQGFVSGVLHCYPDAQGIPLSDTKNIILMTGSLWTPAELAADFRLRMTGVAEKDRKRAIIVMLKTERCCTKEFRACTVTTAALEKRASPLVAEFLVYGAWIKPRDGDKPPGSLRIEKGGDGWKNDAAGTYGFEQGPGATLAFVNPKDGSMLGRTDALRMGLYEKEFVANQGRAPKLDEKLEEVLRLLKPPILSRSRVQSNPPRRDVVVFLKNNGDQMTMLGLPPAPERRSRPHSES